MFIVIEGIDGSGKTTAARLVAQRLNGAEFPFRGKSEIAADDEVTLARAGRLRDLIWASPESAGDTFGATHWILLIASWYAGLARLRQDLTSGHGGVTVMDGWYYRNIAKTLIREPLDPLWVESLFAPVPEPDLTALLDTPPEIAWQRREGFKDTELGRWDGFHGPPAESFHAYQSVVREHLRRMARERGWLVLSPDPTRSPEETADAVVSEFRARSARLPAAPAGPGLQPVTTA
ncbi:dTMP kinase [Streptomyces zaomyceticus]|uniref:dTMP kinase n=1 Tax=Streptomyces zaomyceticus TaxID=68286 RepID=UPI002E1E8D14